MHSKSRIAKVLRRLLIVGTLCEAAAGAAMSPRITATSVVATPPGSELAIRLTIESDADLTNQVLYAGDLATTNWAVLTNWLVAESPYTVTDFLVTQHATRFYRVVALSSKTATGSVRIPAGDFVMGDPLNNGNADELPLHTNYVGEYHADVNLVTFSLWTEVAEWAAEHGYQFGHEGSGKQSDHPVVEVSWYDAVKWCNARSEKEGIVPAYWTDQHQTNVYRTGQIDLAASCVKWEDGYRLPTEAEWEKAARGGVSGHNYPWTDTESFSSDRANLLDDPVYSTGLYPHTSPVGTFPANGYGLYDMAGNVWEWCWDWYGVDWYAAAQDAADSRGPELGDYRVLRGGSWNDDPTSARCAKRGLDSSSSAFGFYGIRCVRGQ